MPPPTLHTERLILCAPKLADFEHWAADVALWPLKGYGGFGIDDRTTGACVGEVGIYEFMNDPEPELGWFVIPAAEGKGYAAEAARAVIAWAHRTLGWDRLINIIDPANDRSIALGLRRGGAIDPTLPGADPGDMVIVHDLRGLA